MANIKYSSNIKDMGLLAKEMKIAAEIYCSTKDLEQVVGRSISFNIFSVATERRKKELADRLTNRLSTLDDYLIDKLANSSPDTTKLLALLALSKNDLLTFEFLNEVYKDKFQQKDAKISDADFNKFFHTKIQQSEIVAKWKLPNIEKLKGALRKILIDAGIGRRFGDDVKLFPPIMDRVIREHVKENGDEIYLLALGVNV